MLMQPFSLWLYSHSFPVILAGTIGFVDRQPLPGGVMAEIRLESLHKRFGDFIAVRDTNLTVADGEFFVLLGPSGCGKTTTLRMIAGLEIPTSGRILLDGEDVTPRARRERDIAFVFQLFALYPHMNVRKNLAFPLQEPGRAAGRDQRAGSTRSRGSCASRTSARSAGLRASPAATASAWRSAAPSSAAPRRS